MQSPGYLSETTVTYIDVLLYLAASRNAFTQIGSSVLERRKNAGF